MLVSRLRAAAHALFPPEGEEEKSKGEFERHLRQGYRPPQKCVKSTPRVFDHGSPLTAAAEALTWEAHVARWHLATGSLSQSLVAGAGGHGTPGTSPGTLGLIALVVGLPVVAAILIVLFFGWVRSPVRRRQRIQARQRAAAAIEAGARAQMSELCPHGWRAQMTLYGPGDELPPGAPTGARSRVALDWAELDDEHGHVAVVRRVWAPTITEALEAMVADRRTDETLEQIERSISHWPEG
jgi:hypothetical protein